MLKERAISVLIWNGGVAVGVGTQIGAWPVIIVGALLSLGCFCMLSKTKT